MNADGGTGVTVVPPEPIHPDLPRGGQCHLWLLRTTDVGWHNYDVLDATERRRAAAFLNLADRLRYLTAHVGTRLVLGRYLRRHPATLRFDRSCGRCDAQHGKPRLTPPESSVHFSFSHSGDLVVLAVAPFPVGADVQIIDSRIAVDDLAGSVLAMSELSRFRALPVDARAHAFFVSWARKEACLKATGDGLRLPMNDLVLSATDQRPALVEWRGRQSRPLLRLADAGVDPGYVAAVAGITGRPMGLERYSLPV